MKEESIKTLEQSLVTIIEKATSGVEKGVEFLSSEIPDVINQLLMWNAIESCIHFIIGILFLAASIFLIRNMFNGARKDSFSIGTEDGDLSIDGASVIFKVVASVILFVSALYNIEITWIKILIAPKVWLIEYAADLVK